MNEPTRTTAIPTPKLLADLKKKRDEELTAKLDALAEKMLDKLEATDTEAQLESKAFDPLRRRDDETTQEYSDRLDRIKDAKKKCDFCRHEKGVHMLGDCGQCDCEKFIPKVFTVQEHLTDRPLAGNPALIELRKKQEEAQKAAREARQKHPSNRFGQKKINPKAKRQA